MNHDSVLAVLLLYRDSCLTCVACDGFVQMGPTISHHVTALAMRGPAGLASAFVSSSADGISRYERH